jgi:peroxiredoxin
MSPAILTPSETKGPLETFRTSKGVSLLELSKDKKVFVAFVRHFGCTFCRQSLTRIAKVREVFKENGIPIVIVHMSDELYGEQVMFKFGIADAHHISDPYQELYRYFGLQKGNWKQLSGWRVILKGLFAGIIGGHGIGRIRGDYAQMPGYFILDRGKIEDAYIPKDVADHPDFAEFANCGCMIEGK